MFLKTKPIKILKFTKKIQENPVKVGNKAENLIAMHKLKLLIPSFIVIFQQKNEKLSSKIATFVKEELPNVTYFAVRSSSVEEDGEKYSFAGMFDSFLYVDLDNIHEKIQKVFASPQNDRVKAYKKQHGILHDIQTPAIIIQEMIDADVSGVAFGVNILHDNPNDMRNEIIINSTWGVGEGVVNGSVDVDTFIVKNALKKPTSKDIISKIATKTHKISLDTHQKHHTAKTEVEADLQNKPSISEKHILEIVEVLKRLEKHFKKPQDIEFCIKNDTLYLLQTRNITTIKPKIQDNNYILWDNSNIIESYPNVTTPLTFSFVSKAYQRAYSLFAGFLGVEKKVIAQNEHVFANTLGLLNGRIYYNLKSWYQMLAMLPSYNINARYMEKMMGVKERFDVPDDYKMSKIYAWWRVIKMGVGMIFKLKNLPKIRKTFTKLVDDTIAEYKNIDYTQKNIVQLIDLYLNFEKTLLQEWKAPLLNDFFAMIYFGRLQKMCEKLQLHDKNPNIHNDLLCGSQNIISTQPIHQTIHLSAFIQQHETLKKMFLDNNEHTIWTTLQEETNHKQDDFSQKNNFFQLKQKIDDYLYMFGERCVGELKLESVSYNQNPTLFIKILKNYVIQGISTQHYNQNTENNIRETAEQTVKNVLGRNFFVNFWKKRQFFKTLDKARDLISQRENLRYERTRAYGVVREIFVHIGKKFFEQNLLTDQKDIFYLTKEEIFAYINGTSVTQNLYELVNVRKKEFQFYADDRQPSERFATYGIVYDQKQNDFHSQEKNIQHTGDLQGVGCCVGVVKQQVQVLQNPNDSNALNNNILVTHSTDPSWVVLFPQASGILVERGSLLSHSAIVAREMGKPCIVGITGLMKTLETGMTVEMNGSTGKIDIIKKS